jgi:hypothetical protein
MTDPFAASRSAGSVARLTNSLAKALIIDTTTGTSYPVLCNPEEYKLEQGNNVVEVGIPGQNAAPVQYVRGKARSLSMDLFFDTYEVAKDVRAYTGPVVRLLDKIPQTGAPPILVFSMGRFQFQCVLADAGQRYTMFLADGTPVRSILSVRFLEFVRVDVEIERGVFFGSPTASAAATTAIEAGRSVFGGSPTVHVTVAGDTLSGLATAYLGDPALWRDIARANKIDDPLSIAPGAVLVIPTVGGANLAGRRG